MPNHQSVREAYRLRSGIETGRWGDSSICSKSAGMRYQMRALSPDRPPHRSGVYDVKKAESGARSRSQPGASPGPGRRAIGTVIILATVRQMHAALFIDPERLKRERDWFNRTVVGLVSAGVQITRILPENEPDDERVSLAPAIWYEDSGVPWTARQRHADLAGELSDTKAPDVIHAMGRGIWADALDLAQRIERPVVIDVWTADECSDAVRFARKPEVGGVLAAGDRVAAALQELGISRELIQVVPIGVYVKEPGETRKSHPSADGKPADAMRGIVGIIAASGARFDAIAPLLNAFAAISQRFPNFMLFGDFRERDGDKVWRHLKSLDLLDHLSLIPCVQEHRELVLQSDLLLLPAPLNANSSFLLQAMAAPLTTLAVRDPYVDILQQNPCALLLDETADESDWQAALESVLCDVSQAAVFCNEARAWISKRNGVSRQVEILADTYDRIITGGAHSIT